MRTQGFPAAMCALALLTWTACDQGGQTAGSAEDGPSSPLLVVVMDPLALPLSCSCLSGTGQRDYAAWAAELEARLDRPVALLFEESLALAHRRLDRRPDLVIGIDSVVRRDLADLGWEARPVAALSDREGKTTWRGQVVVRREGPRALAALEGATVWLGPEEEEALAAGVRGELAGLDAELRQGASYYEGVFALADGEAAAAVIGDYALPLLESCGKIEKDSLVPIAHGEPRPFIVAFALGGDAPRPATLIAAGADEEIRARMESRDGFVSVARDD